MGERGLNLSYTFIQKWKLVVGEPNPAHCFKEKVGLIFGGGRGGKACLGGSDHASSP